MNLIVMARAAGGERDEERMEHEERGVRRVAYDNYQIRVINDEKFTRNKPVYKAMRRQIFVSYRIHKSQIIELNLHNTNLFGVSVC
jgi:hypothetical protein